MAERPTHTITWTEDDLAGVRCRRAPRLGGVVRVVAGFPTKCDFCGATLTVLISVRLEISEAEDARS